MAFRSFYLNTVSPRQVNFAMRIKAGLFASLVALMCVVVAAGAQAQSARVCYNKKLRQSNSSTLMHMLSARSVSCADSLNIQLIYARKVDSGWCDLNSGCIVAYKPHWSWACESSNVWKKVGGTNQFGTSYYCWYGAHRQQASELFAYWKTDSRSLNKLPPKRSAAQEVIAKNL
jgi:hypothetical protein